VESSRHTVFPRGLRVSGLGPANAALFRLIVAPTPMGPARWIWPPRLEREGVGGSLVVTDGLETRKDGRGWRGPHECHNVDTVCRAVGLGRCIVVDAFSRASTVAYATTRALWVGKTQVLFCSLFGELTLSARLRTIVRLSQNIIIERWVEFQYSTTRISILFIKMCVPC
jgi:hypothetical protein